MGNFDFGKYWQKAQKEAGIEEGDESFHGVMQVKDIEKVVREVMTEWRQNHDGASQNFWDELASSNDKPSFARFLTPDEYNRLFDENLGLQLDRELYQAERMREERIRRQAEDFNNKGATPNNIFDRIDKSLDTSLDAAILKKFSGHKEAKEVLKRFYRLYPAYALFYITSEIDRRRVAEKLQQDEDNYFWAMRASNPTLSDFFLLRRRFRIPEPARQMHTYIVAGTGAGKSELLKSFIWQHIVQQQTGLIILDPNGDFAEQVAKFQEFAKPEFRERLVYFDPYLSSSHVPVINPFELPEDAPEEAIDLAVQQIYKMLNQSFTELDSAPTAQMQLILLNILPVILRKPDGSLRDLFRFLDFQANSDLVELGKNMPNQEIRRFFQTKFTIRDLAPSIPGLESRLYRMATSGLFMKLVCGKSTINLKQAMNEKKIVVFNLSKGILGDDLSKIFGRFILTSIYNMIFSRAGIPEQQRVPCHIYIDEFHNYITSTIKEAFVEGRKYKGYLTVVTQMIGQDMSADFKDLILGNANVRIIGKSGYKSRREMMQEMDVDEETERVTGISKKSFKKLQQGEFIVQVGNLQAFKMTNRTRLLKDKHAMAPELWEQIKEEQIVSYYTTKQDTPPGQQKEQQSSGQQKPHPSEGDRKQGEQRPFSGKYDF